MLSFIAAATLFTIVVAIAVTLTSRDEADALPGDAPRKLPDPGARDVYAMVPGTLSRAYVPSWG